MAAPAILKIDIIADATRAIAGLNKTEGAAKSTSSKFSALGKAVVGGAAVGAVVAFGKASVGAALDSQKATAGLEQVFRSMGDTTGQAAKQAENYAGALSRKIGVDDEAIMSAQTLLATFGSVSSETGRQAGIFDRATAAAADLAAAGYGDMAGNAKLLGKALNDPVRGMATLRKSGVQLTAAQQEQVKAFVASGDVLSAQKILLGEVEHQVGGTAAKTATSTDKMNVAWGETQESVGKALIPVLEKLLPILTSVANFIQRNISWIMPLAAVLGVLAIAWNIASIAATLFGVSMLAALWPVLLVIAAIAALVAIGILIVRNWDTIKAAALAVWSVMVAAWNAILGALKTVWQWIATNWPLLLAILTGPIGIAVLLIVRNWDTIKNAALGVFNWIRSNWPLLLAILTGPIGAAVLLITRNWDTIKRAASDLYNWVTDKLQGIADFFSGIARTIGGFASSIADAIKRPINAVIDGWNRLQFTVPKVDLGPFGSIGGQTIGFPDIPRLATGGSVLRTGLAIVHAGETFSGVGNELGGGVTNITVNVTATGLGADVPEIQRGVVNALRGYASRNGPIDVPVRRSVA